MCSSDLVANASLEKYGWQDRCEAKLIVLSENATYMVKNKDKGAAGLAQQVRKNRSLPRRLSAQKSPKGAAGLAQQVRKNRSLPQRLSAQKSPKGAVGLAQQVRKETEVYRKDYPRRSRLRVQPD